jgi:lipopolysaccharide transport system permease protein
MDMANSVTDNLSLVTKVYFPREILPISALLARLFDFLVAAALLVVLIIVYRLPLHPVAWLALPLVLAIQTLLATGIGLALAAVNVFYRDVRPLLTLGIQLWFYASPILYPVTLVPEQIRPYYFLNPMAAILEAYRDILLTGRMPGIYLGPTIIMATLIFVSGYWGFKQLETQFADII